ncbi:ABC transporter substrate-binding protein [Devosia sp. ZB163]|jgi:glucose/mannose transport system substrate-binding protein|uniref:ABC transporter substrate-binding protein n=1 Tax=Devosia sp. ZB163 TaxID=3025938 RepID=UPI00235E1921|nr:ABC transporter substrate-binding protein [Devosia sp. ZB163]MDC9824177.1 ABC transporter substrate-binding protein [Devosia sp. ZB163]
MKSVVSVVALVAAALLGSTAVRAADVEVIHWWTSGGEQAAVSVFAREFDALGGDKWVDTAIAGGENARSATLQRILGGDPPGAAQFNPGRQYEELIAGGMLLDLTDLANKEGWANFIRPASISEACLVDGHWWCVPVNIHSWNWAWASVPAFEKAGVELPTSFDDFLEKAPKLKEAGIIPFAIGGESWQINGAFGVIQTGLLGLDKREKIIKDKDLELAKAEMPAVFEKFRQFKQFSDEGSANRNWNDTTNLVVTDQAALQIMGDWARGEFGVAGEKAGVDYACLALPLDKPTVSTGGDIFLFPKQSDAAVEAAQLKMASMMVNPQVQALFNNAKGSMPIRDDVDMSLADDCMKRGLEIIKDPANIAVDAGRWQSNDTTGQMNDLVAQFWADDSMTAAAAAEQYVTILQNAD